MVDKLLRILLLVLCLASWVEAQTIPGNISTGGIGGPGGGSSGGGTGDIDGVTAGSGLTGGGITGTVTLNVGVTAPITSAADAVECPTCVVGPASATNSVPALYDGTTGKLLKNSTPTGTGNPVLQTSPQLTTPDIGAATGTSAVLTGDASAANLKTTSQTLYMNSAGTVFIKAGTGAPEGVVTAGIGSIWIQTDGSIDTSIYRKESGTSNTGWIAVANPTIVALPATDTPLDTDILHIVTDPDGTPIDNKVTVADLFALHPEVQTIDNVFDQGKEIDGANSSTNAFKVGDGTTKFYLYSDPTSGLQLQCFAGAVLNNCNYYRDLLAGKKAGFKDSSGNIDFEYDETTGVTKALKGASLVDVTQIVEIVRFSAADPAVNDTDYLGHTGTAGSAPVSATTASGKAMIGFTGFITELNCKIQTAPTSTHTIVFTVATVATAVGSLVDSSPAMACTITSTATTCSTVTNPVAITKADFVGIKKVDSTTATPSDQSNCFVRIEG